MSPAGRAAILLMALAIPSAVLAVRLDSWGWLAAQVIMQGAALALVVRRGSLP